MVITEHQILTRFLEQTLEVGAIIFPILQMEKPRTREIKELSHSRTASKPGFKTM